MSGASPRVCIGIPTYNRPEGLKRTLSCLLAQTCTDFGILVSDNCSPGDATRQVVEEFMRRDGRIRYVRQGSPLSIGDNFKYVLRNCQGEFFMWAADDDEWSPTFLERCLEAIRDGTVSAMSGFVTLYRANGRMEPASLPDLNPHYPLARNLSAFLRRLTPSLIYGVHRRSAICFFLEDELFDYYDCYFLLRLLANGGIVLVDEPLYVAGVDGAAYQAKPMHPSWGSGLRVLPFYRSAARVISGARLDWQQRAVLRLLLTVTVARILMVNEGTALFRRLRILAFPSR